MAMSRIFSQSLSRASLRPRTALISHHRHRSNNPHHAKLEDTIHSVSVRRAEPDWLPFLPGYSYWVPPSLCSEIRAPHLPDGMIEAIGKIAASGVARNRGLPLDLLSEEEHMAFTSAKGLPSSALYIEGTSTIHSIPVVEMEVKIQDNEDQADNTSNSNDEEG